MLLGTVDASLLGNLLGDKETDKGVICVDTIKMNFDLMVSIQETT